MVFSICNPNENIMGGVCVEVFCSLYKEIVNEMFVCVFNLISFSVFHFSQC